MNAVSDVRRCAGGATTEAECLSGTQCERYIVCRVGEDERLIEGTLACKYYGRQNDDYRKHHHQFD